MVPDKYINRNGYIVRKNTLQPSELKAIKEELTVSPFTTVNIPGQIVKSFKVYRENENKLYVPIFYGITKFGDPEHNFLNQYSYQNINIVFKGNLKEEQKEVVQEFFDCITKTPGGILQLPCGFGKTVIGIYIISRLKLKTLIVVHKEFLMNQWIERINMFIENPRIGVIQQNKIDIVDKDIVIAMVQSICLKDYDPSIFHDFGFVIYDECHHLGAEMFSKTFSKVTTKFCLGLSATPNRKDGLRKVFEWHLGKVIVKKESNTENNVEVEILNFTDTEKFPFPYSPRKRASLVSFVCDSNNRNDFIINKIKELYPCEIRRILILSERRSQLEYISAKLNESNFECGFYIGGMKQKCLDESSKKRIILGTFQMASEGMDIPALNTIILASPKSDIEQSVGRILRTKHSVPPLVIDIVDDDYESFLRQYYTRHRFYKKMKFSMKKQEILEIDTVGECLFIE
jgi:superfamily II DNA or RNA helicase